MTHMTAEGARPHPILSRLRGILATWRRELERHRVFERTYGELASLSDRELSDIGVSRWQIVEIAWDAADRV